MNCPKLTGDDLTTELESPMQVRSSLGVR